jgi:F0F1-type ATP synthase assembly protein I
VKEGLETDENFKISVKMISPFILGTWVVYLISKAVMIPAGSDWAYYDINQINHQPFYLFGLEFIVAVGLLYGMNLGVKFLIRKLPNTKTKTMIPFVIFAVMSLVLVLSGLVTLQNIPAEAFIQP